MYSMNKRIIILLLLVGLTMGTVFLGACSSSPPAVETQSNEDILPSDDGQSSDVSSTSELEVPDVIESLDDGQPSMREVIAAPTKYLEEETELTFGPVKVMHHDLGKQTLRVRPSTGPNYLQYDQDIHLNVEYGHLPDGAQWHHLSAADRQEVTVTGILKQHPITETLYLEARTYVR